MINERGSQTFCTATVLKGLQCGMSSAPNPSSSRFTYNHVHWTPACTEMQQPAARAKVQTLLAFSCPLSDQLHQEHYQDMGLEKQSPESVCGWARLWNIEKGLQVLCHGPIKVMFLRPSTALTHIQLCYVFYKSKTEPWKRGNELDPRPRACGQSQDEVHGSLCPLFLSSH